MRQLQKENRQRIQIVLSLRYVFFLHSSYSHSLKPLQDAESRLSTLRVRAGITPPPSPPRGTDTDSSITPVASGSVVPLSNGHINLFADLEEHTAALAARASKSKPAMTDSDCGIPLAPTKQDLHPWYSAAGSGSNDDKTAEARRCVLLPSSSTFPRACCRPY